VKTPGLTPCPGFPITRDMENRNDLQFPSEPFYLPSGNEVELFTAAYADRLPVMLKGPTGCGKTRFVEHMAWRLSRPLVTVACHEDLFASDLVGRYLLVGGETVWSDGPLTRAVRMGALCYLDEIVEARKDTTVVIHPLADDRRILSMDRTGEILSAHPDFALVISYNPGYQSVMKDLKPSTRQRFVAISFDYPAPDAEKRIVRQEAGVDEAAAGRLVALGQRIRSMREQGLAEGASTRLLVYAGRLMGQGVDPKSACRIAMAAPLTDDESLLATMEELITDLF